MRALIDVPFRDAAAEDLAWALERDGRPPAGLAGLDVAGGPWPLRLHVLGASHAVELSLPDGVRITETVACGLADGRALERAPQRLDAHGLHYAFSSTVEVPGTAGVVALAARLHRELAVDPGGLVAAFPGAPGATTGLRARVDAVGAAWETWHLYPERGEVVRTRSRARLGVASPAAGPAGVGARVSPQDRATASPTGAPR